MSEITGNIMSDWKKENDFDNEAKKMMKLYEDEQPEVIIIPQDEINEESVRKFYDYSCTYANKVDGMLRVTIGGYKYDECDFRYLNSETKFYKELKEDVFVVSPIEYSRDYNGMIKFIYNSFVKGKSVFVAFQEYAGTPIWMYTHLARATNEFSPKEYCIEDVLRAIGRDFRSCLHA